HVSHAMLLNVVARDDDPFPAMRHLLTDNHEDPAAQRRHIRRAVAVTRALLAGGVIEKIDGRYRLVDDLQLDFALNQALSPFALACLELLDRESPDYPLDVVSVIEATLEDPRQVLAAQRQKARGEAVNAMKAEGIEYEQRMELLEGVTHPRPLLELLEDAYETYRRGHPWVADHEIKPKAVARDMYERAMTFTEYVSFYGLSRSEGLVLRYLADAYRALRQTVPEDARTEELADLIEWLGELVRQVDSSLLDEWERLRHPSVEAPEVRLDDKPPAVTRNVRAFRVLVRNALFRRVELAALGRYDPRRYDELGELDAEAGWTADRWRATMADYFAEYDELGTGPAARGPALLQIETGSLPAPAPSVGTEDPSLPTAQWTVRQVFDDPAGDHDWGITATVDLAASDELGAAAVTVTGVGPL
ncbi:MAG TPA: DUF3516 domain-containing protein, partial [Actinoplanes sp.]|nr:DUF3516 domain-containing protein [Actinoplanes sp.]